MVPGGEGRPGAWGGPGGGGGGPRPRPRQGPLYPCPECPRVFRWQGNLRSHRRQECGKEPSFFCPYCPHRTKLKGNLRKHAINKHRDLFRPEDF